MAEGTGAGIRITSKVIIFLGWHSRAAFPNQLQPSSIRSLVEKNHGVVEYVATAEALEYRESKLKEENGNVDPYDQTLETADKAEAA